MSYAVRHQLRDAMHNGWEESIHMSNMQFEHKAYGAPSGSNNTCLGSVVHIISEINTGNVVEKKMVLPHSNFFWISNYIFT